MSPPRAGIASADEEEARGAEGVPASSKMKEKEPEGKEASLSQVKGEKPAAAVRVWSPADELGILEGLAAHAQKHNSPPARSQLRDAVAGRLVHKTDFTVTEIYEKVRRLRTRFVDRPASYAGDADELRKYELSKLIWGKSNLPVKRAANGEAGGSGAPARRGFQELEGLYPHLALLVQQISTANKGCLKRAFELIGDGKAAELDAKIKKHRLSEIQTQQHRRNLQNEVRKTLITYVDGQGSA